MSTSRGYAQLGAALVSTGASAAFYVNQNRGEAVGGPIHWSKAAWLNMTVLAFIVLPLTWWRSPGTGPAPRRALRMLFLQFFGRGLIEIPMIYYTRWWKCGYGISHDAAVLGIMGAMLIRDSGEIDLARDGDAIAFCAFAMTLLAVEGCFAKMFRAVNDPVDGIYFADDSPKFRRVIRVTKSVVFVAYPVLALLMWRAHRSAVRDARG